MVEQDRLTERYGARGPWQRVFPAIAVLLAVILAGWLVWTIWARSAPQVTSSLEDWDIVDAHAATATVIVKLADDATGASCTLRAFAEDHTTVGELRFTPQDGRQVVTIRTEREATSVEKVGCTADGQHEAR